MCYYITGILSPGAEGEKVKDLAESHHLQWKPISIPSLQKQLNVGETIYWTTRGTCDCNSDIGGLAHEEQISYATKRDDLIEKCQRKGWGKAKIDRLLCEWDASQRRIQQTNENARLNSLGDVTNWMGLIRDVLTLNAARHIGLLKHAYSGDVVTESVPIVGRRRVELKELTSEHLAYLCDDVLFTVSHRRKNSSSNASSRSRHGANAK